MHLHSEERGFWNGRSRAAGKADMGALHLLAWQLLCLSFQQDCLSCLRTRSGFFHSMKQSCLPPARDEPQAIEPFDPSMDRPGIGAVRGGCLQDHPGLDVVLGAYMVGTLTICCFLPGKGLLPTSNIPRV